MLGEKAPPTAASRGSPQPVPGSQVRSGRSTWDGGRPPREPQCCLHPRCPRRPGIGRAAARPPRRSSLWSDSGFGLLGVKGREPMDTSFPMKKNEGSKPRKSLLCAFDVTGPRSSSPNEKGAGVTPHEGLQPWWPGPPTWARALPGRRWPQEVPQHGSQWAVCV